MSHPVIEADECIGCGICVDACPQEVLEVVNGVADARERGSLHRLWRLRRGVPHGRYPGDRRGLALNFR